MKSKREKLEALLKIAQREGIVPSDALIEVGKYNTRDLIKELATIPELWDAAKLSGMIPADQYPLFSSTERGAVPPTEGRVGIILTEHGWDRKPTSQFIQTMGGGRGGGGAGTPGPQGIPGTNGTDGINGTNGVDGTNGIDGADGIGIEWLGTFPNAPLAPTLNQAYRNSTDGIAYIWNGLAWSEMVEDGVDGINGTNGTNGVDGAPGPTGTAGYTPIKGVDYFDGATGSQGPAGPNYLSSGTSTNINGILMGNGSYVVVATPDVHYVLPVSPSVVGNFVAFDSLTGSQSDSGYNAGNFDVAGAAASITLAGLGGQPSDPTLTSLSALADAVGWLHNDGAGGLAYSTPAGGSGDVIDSGIVVGQLVKGVTDSKHVIAAALIPPATNILTLTNSAASTLALAITAAKTLTLTAADDYNITFPASMTPAGLAVQNVFTAIQKINVNSATAFLVEQDGVKDNVFLVDTTSAVPGVTVGYALNLVGGNEMGGTAGSGVLLKGKGNLANLDYFSLEAKTTNQGIAFSCYPNGAPTDYQYAFNFCGSADAIPTTQLLFLGSKTLKKHIMAVDNATSAGNPWSMEFRVAGNNQAWTAAPAVMWLGTGAAANTIYVNGSSRVTMGGTLGYAKLHVIGTTDYPPFRVDGYTTQSYPIGNFYDLTSATNIVRNVLNLDVNSSGTPAAGLGDGILFAIKSSTTASQNAARVYAITITATHASRAYALVGTAYDTAEREGWRVQASGTAPMIGFLGAAPVVRQTELTDELTTVTCSAPGTPDYAIQDLISVAGYGFVSLDEGLSVLKVVANLQTRVNELETKLVAYGLLIDAD